MTAREFAEMFKPYLVMGQIVERAGWSQSAWYAAVSRERELNKEEMKQLRLALQEHAQMIRQMARNVK